MKSSFFSTSLLSATHRIDTAARPARFLLDKNEQPEDVCDEFKRKTLEQLYHECWNRYPSANYSDIESNIAAYCGMQPENIILSAGSATLITTLLNYFAINRKKLVITQPTYSLFEYHCRTYNIPFEPWLLNDALEYDLGLLPVLEEDSVLVITSPNNPVGNSINHMQLEYILETHPDALVILDAVYAEFSEADLTSLVKIYPNLIVLRSFSKAFPIAGLRLGYAVAHPPVASLIRKLLLQFSINPLALVFARTILFDPSFRQQCAECTKEICRERELLYSSLAENFHPDRLYVHKSDGNFLLVKIANTEEFDQIFNGLCASGIKMLNTSGFLLLKNTFRVSIGSRQENELFRQCMLQSMPAMAIAC